MVFIQNNSQIQLEKGKNAYASIKDEDWKKLALYYLKNKRL